jgi:hypothetical protein
VKIVKTLSLNVIFKDVGVWSSGPWSKLFTGNFEQSYIPILMARAAGIGPYYDEKQENQTTTTLSSETTTSANNDTTTTDNASQLGLNFFLVFVICLIKIAM